MAGNILYVGGNFNAIQTPTPFLINHLAAINTDGTVYTNWVPDISNAIADSVDTMVVDSGKVFFGGDFETVGGQPYNNLAAVNAVIDINSTADPVSSWNLNSQLFNQFYALHAQDGVIYVGGGFDHIGRPYQMDFAKFDVNGKVK